MKRLFTYLILASSVFLCSCEREQRITERDDKPQIILSASVEQPSGTKTAVQEDNSVFWDTAEELKVFCGGKSAKFTSTNEVPAGSVYFKGDDIITENDDEIWALYPYDENATFSDGVITATIPAEQVACAGTFARNTNVTVARSESGAGLMFYNVCGGVRFSVTRSDVKEMVFEALGGESVAGKVKLGFSDNVPVVKEIIDGKNYITLTAPGGGTFEAGKWYYIVVLPGVLSEGFKMTFNTETEYAVLKSTDARTVNRGIFGSLADADDDLIFKDKESLYFSIPESSLNGWHEGACTLCDDAIDKFLLIQKDTLTELLYFYLNTDGKNEEDGYILTLVPDSTGYYLLSTIHHSNKDYYAINGEDALNIISFDDGVANVFQVKYADYSEPSTKSTFSLQGTVRHYLNWKRMPDYYSMFNTIGNIVNNDYGNLLKSFLVDKLVSYAGLKGWKAVPWQIALDLSLSFGYEKLKSGFLGSAEASITNIKRTDEATIAVTVEVNNANTIPDMLLSDDTSNSISNEVYLGVAVGMDDHPGYYLNKWQSELSVVNKTSNSFVFYLNIPLSDIKTYYFRPFLIPYNSPVEVTKRWLTLIRYGDPKPYTDFIINLSGFNQTGCTKLAENKYKVTFTIDGVLEGDVDLYNFSWGFVISDLKTVFASDGQYISPKSKHFEVEIELETEKNREEIQLTPFVLPRNSSPIFVYGDPITETVILTDSPCIDGNHVHAIDLGLSVKWACCNIGASSPEEYGDYYGWGEIGNNRFHGNFGYIIGYNISGTQYDIAHVKWGDKWRMPTEAEFEELMCCCSEWTTVNGVKGRKFTSNGNSIFLPAAGSELNGVSGAGSFGYYWTSNYYGALGYYNGTDDAWSFYFHSGNVNTYHTGYYAGQSIRPVTEY